MLDRMTDRERILAGQAAMTHLLQDGYIRCGDPPGNINDAMFNGVYNIPGTFRWPLELRVTSNPANATCQACTGEQTGAPPIVPEDMAAAVEDVKQRMPGTSAGEQLVTALDQGVTIRELLPIAKAVGEELARQ